MRSNKMIEKMFVAVFSYNRGNYLSNCIESIEKHINPKELIIYDDHSTCIRTQETLDSLRENYNIISDSYDSKDNIRKGLYTNMNQAVEYAIDNSYDYILMIQDDMQVVRNWNSTFTKEVENIFSSNQSIVQIVPVFFKSSNRNIDSKRLIINEENNYYMNRYIPGVSDVGIIKLNKIKLKRWKFGDNEPQNMKETVNFGWKSVKMKNPIFMYTPWPETFRAGSVLDKILLQITEKVYNTGFYPYQSMSRKSIDSLINRPIDKFPYAEDYLATIEPTKKPWVYTSSLTYIKIKIYRYLKKSFKLIKT